MPDSKAKNINDLLIELSPVGLFILDLQSKKIIKSNEKAAGLLGTSTEELLKFNILDVFFHKNGNGYEKIRNIEKLSCNTVFHIKTKLNNYVPVRVQTEIVIYNEKESYLIYIESIQPEIANTNIIHQLASIVESSDDAIISKDLNGNVISWNKAAEKVYGYTVSEMIGESILKVYPLNKKDELKEILTKISNGERIENFETQRIRKDGKSVDISVTMSPVKDFSGSITGASSIERDITQRKLMDAERFNREKQLLEAQQIAHLGYWELEVKSGNIHWSDELYKIYGLDKNEFVPTEENFISKIHHEDKKTVKEVLDKALHDRRSFELNHRIILPSGETRIIYGRGEVILDSGYKPAVIRGIEQDITEQKRAERRLAAQFEVTKILAESNRLIEATLKILQAVCLGMDWQIGELWLVDNESDLLELEGTWSTPDLTADEFIEVSKKCKFGRGVSLQGRTWEKQEPIWSNHMIEDQFFPRAGFATKLNLNTALAVPVFNKVKVSGVLALYKVDISEPDDELLKMLESLGRQIGDFIEKKKSEPALKESESLYQTLVETSPDAITYTDLSGKILFCNQQAAELFGYRLVEDIVGQNVYAFIAPEDQGHAVKNEHNTIVNGKTKEVEYTLIKKDGTRFPAEINTSIVFDAENSPKAFIGVMRDISERKKAENEIKSRAQQQSIITEIGRSALEGLGISELIKMSEELITKTLEIEFCGLWELQEKNNKLCLMSGTGWKNGAVGEISIESGETTYAGYTLQKNEPVIVHNFRTEKRFKQTEILTEHNIISGVTVIIQGESKPFGVLGSYSKKVRTFSQNDVYFLQAISNIIGTAIGRKYVETELERSFAGVKHAKNEIEYSKKRMEYLADASGILNSSLDYNKTLNTVAELIIKEFADWCIIYMLGEQNNLKRIAIACADPSKSELVKQLESEYQPNPELNPGMFNALKTGEPLLYHEIDDSFIRKVSADEKQYKIYKNIGLTSALIVPLKVREKTIGTICLISSNINRLYDESDLIFAQDLAYRVSGAIDNSRLFEESVSMNERLEKKVKARTSELEISNTELEVEIKMRQKIAEELRGRVLQQSALTGLGQMALRNSSLPGIIDSAVNLVAKTLNVEYCGLFELSADNKKLILVSGKGWTHIKEGDFVAERGENSLISYLLASNETVLTEDILKQKKILVPEFLKVHNVQSGLGVVIRENNVPYGLMIAYSSEKKNYTVNDSNFLNSISNVLSAFVERKNAEEMTRGLLEAVPEAVILLNGQGKIILANTQTEVIFGYKKEEILFKEVEILIPAKFRNQHLAERNEYLKHPWHRPMNSGIELSGRRSDGTEFPAEISLSPFNTRRGNLITVSVRDISERIENERTMRNQARLINQIQGAVVSTDLKGNVKSWNKGAERLFGYTADEMVGENISSLYGKDNDDYVKQKIVAPLTEKGFHEYEILLIKKSGEKFYAHLSLTLLKSKYGRVTGMIGYSLDITGRKKAERKFDNFIEEFNEALIISDYKGKILNINPAAENLFNYEKKELIGRKIGSILSPRVIDKISQIITGTVSKINNFDSEINKEYFGIDRNDKEFFIRFGLNTIESEKGKIIICSVRKYLQ